jgi:ABC-type phosphate transport system substrate-binding protein
MDLHVLIFRPLALLIGCIGLTLGVSRASADTPTSSSTTEPLVFIVHRSNPADNLSLQDLKKLFRGERRKWAHGRNVTLVMREPGAPERNSVLEHVYAMDDAEFAKYFLHAAFVGQVSGPPKQLNSSVGMLKFVFNVPGAIGYVRASELDDSVKPIQINGLPHQHPDYPVRLALMDEESTE